uniref:Uncharacterized protein n=1 Tax=Arundo donax TaxID=35708 RepID=A0A0A9DI59_ARUDO
MAASLTPSCCSRCLRRSVETATAAAVSPGPTISLEDILGNMSLVARSASSHAALSSLVSARRCSLFVPEKIENLLSSDLLSLTVDTLRWISPMGLRGWWWPLDCEEEEVEGRDRRRMESSPMTLAPRPVSRERTMRSGPWIL